MRLGGLIVTLAAMGLLTGCRSYRHSEIVQESYVHKYGVPVAKEDWSRNGKNGAVVQLRSDGVTVTKNYANGILDGKSIYTFVNSSTAQFIETYNQGALVSKVEQYRSGVPSLEEKYEGNELVQKLRWYEDGTPAGLENYVGGAIVYGEYRTTANEIESKVTEGKGIRILRGHEGELLFKDTIEGGQMVERVAFFPNGEPSSVTPYQEGEIHGKRLTYLPGGLPNTAEEWVCGKQEGITTAYLNGEKLAEIPYVAGKKEGIEKRFRDGTMLMEEVTWVDDVQHGPRKIFLEDDQSKTEWFLQGQAVSRTTFERMNVR